MLDDPVRHFFNRVSSAPGHFIKGVFGALEATERPLPLENPKEIRALGGQKMTLK